MYTQTYTNSVKDVLECIFIHFQQNETFKYDIVLHIDSQQNRFTITIQTTWKSNIK